MEILHGVAVGGNSIMSSNVHYAQPLRALGQALELLNVGAFDMEVAEENFVVRGRLLPSKFTIGERLAPESAVREIWGSMPQSSTFRNAPPAIPLAPLATLELTYSPKDVDRLEKEGQAKRSNPAGMADAASLSQLLRTVGGYLTQKRAKLLKISKNEQSMTVHYNTAQGHRAQDVLSLSDLYEFCVRMYTKRSGREGASL